MCVLFRICKNKSVTDQCTKLQVAFDMTASAPHLETITNKISKSELNVETKEVFSLLLTYFDHILREKNSQANDLKDRVSTLEKKVEKLESLIDQTSQYERRDTLIISGEGIPISTPEENCKNIVIELFRQQLRLNIDERDVSVAHQLAAKLTTNLTSETSSSSYAAVIWFPKFITHVDNSAPNFS